MSTTWWLIASVVAEAIGLAALRASRGLRRPLPAVLAFVGMEGSVVLIGQAIVGGLSLAVGYAVWTGAGIAFAALGGVLVFGDRLTRRQALGLGLVMVGVTLLNAGSTA